MIRNTKVIISKSVSPYHNLALEEYLLDFLPEDTLILYLWQNDFTVVIGQNQNAWQECRVKELEEAGGHLARRLSGGGAVFHDMGNLNFTFLVPRSDYDVAKQCDVIKTAAASFGLSAERTGRNDILASGRKFSGNAFYKKDKSAYHHGTILISSDMSILPKYLNVSEEKLKSKGVKSVEARVVNLSSLSKEVTVKTMTERLIEALGEVYKIEPEILCEEDLDAAKIAALTEKYSSWEWVKGRKIPFTKEIKKRFAWGEVNICLSVDKGIVEDAKVYSDAMDSSFISSMSDAFKGLRYSAEELKNALLKLKISDELGYETTELQKEDILALLSGEDF